LKNYQAFKNEIEILRKFTIDLNDIENISLKYPFFYKHIIIENCYSDCEDILAKERVKYLKKFDVLKIFKEVMEIWSLHCAKLVPDPSINKDSSYWDHVRFLKAVLEINPEKGNKILQLWKSEHSKRKKLWKEFEKN